MTRLVLAPMEGLADDVLREVLTGTGAYDWCVTEFVRVTDTVLPHRVYTRLSPEMANGARTPAGTPVRVQLMGADPDLLAANAAHLAKLQPFGIDLNFGCPAPLVFRHGGGAALLAEPERLRGIVAAVRAAVPATLPVTAKMRLGIDDTHRALDCARALAEGGADELVVHARTKADGYQPTVRWEWVARIREAVRIPVIANGEVWTVADYHAIRAATGCADVMLGRGAVADPLLASRIKADDRRVASAYSGEDWARIQPMLARFWQKVQAKVQPRQSPGRLKQWLGMMRRHYPQAEALLREIRELRTGPEVHAVMAREGMA